MPLGFDGRSAYGCMWGHVLSWKAVGAVPLTRIGVKFYLSLCARPQVWHEFSALLKSDRTFGYLHDIVDVLTAATLPEQLQPPAVAAAEVEGPSSPSLEGSAGAGASGKGQDGQHPEIAVASPQA